LLAEITTLIEESGKALRVHRAGGLVVYAAETCGLTTTTRNHLPRTVSKGESDQQGNGQNARELKPHNGNIVHEAGQNPNSGSTQYMTRTTLLLFFHSFIVTVSDTAPNQILWR